MGREASQREWFLYWVLKQAQDLLSEKRWGGGEEKYTEERS